MFISKIGSGLREILRKEPLPPEAETFSGTFIVSRVFPGIYHVYAYSLGGVWGNGGLSVAVGELRYTDEISPTYRPFPDRRNNPGYGIALKIARQEGLRIL